MDTLIAHARCRSTRYGGPLPGTARAGFTVIELLVVLAIGTALVVGASVAIVSQSRLFTAQAELTEARTTLRGASALLATTLMEAAATGDDLAAISATSFTVRSYHMAGTVCSKVNALTLEQRLGLQELRGGLEGGVTAYDSVMVYDLVADEWMAAELDAAWDGAAAWDLTGGQTPVCFWGDSTVAEPRPQVAVRLDAPAAVLGAIRVGAPLRVFRSTEYGLFERAGEWWLGRRVSGSSDWELLTGPLLSPSDEGLDLTYFQRDGTVATVASDVSAVEIFMWSKGGPQEVDPSAADQPAQDSVRTRIHLRNNRIGS